MEKEVIDTNWEEMLAKFYTYKGTIADFCKENKIKTHQLYYQRKRAEKINKTIFHAITLNKQEKPTVSNNAITNNTFINSTAHKSILPVDIKVEIGKVKIYIPVDDSDSLLTIIKEIVKSC